MHVPSDSHWRRLAVQAQQANIPFSVMLELTSRCPQSCIHCYLQEARADELPTETWKRTLDELANLGTMFVALTGGEPFTRPDVLEIAAHARSHGMAVSFMTSGTGLSPGDLDGIAAVHPLRVCVTLFSVQPTIHDRITQCTGSHQRALSVITGLRSRNVRVRIGAPILSLNVKEIPGVVQLASELGAEFTFDPTVMVCRDGRCHPVQLRPTPEQLAPVLALPQLRTEGLLGPPPAPDSALCAAGRRIATIQPDGTVVACSMDPRGAGRLGEQSFTEIWLSSPLLKEIRALTVSNLDGACNGCPRAGYCSRCSAQCLVEHGNYLGKSATACSLARARELAEELARRGSG